MIRLWANGTRAPSDHYSALLARAFGVAEVQAQPETLGEFEALLGQGDSAIDDGTVVALEAHTQSLRVLDRRLGARRLLTQSEAHARAVADLVQWSSLGRLRSELAAAGAEAAALAGWQALDLGRPRASWRLHAEARSLAYESGDPSVIAHVTAQQAYVLLDSGRTAQAVSQFERARAQAGSRVPGVVRSWLAAAEAEARAAAGDSTRAVRLLDDAERALDDERLPFIVLDSAHLARWRGHCLARLGDAGAVTSLDQALRGLDPEFSRAAAGLHIDLSIAHTVGGDRDSARHHATKAAHLSATTGSERQRARVRALLEAEGP
ncbi:MAG: hypothetical protein ACRCSN_15770 [Dermatophilaceae bacterium]